MNAPIPVATVEYRFSPGFRQLQAGDVVQLDGGPHVVTRVNGSGACAEPVSRKKRVGKTRFGKEFSVPQAGKVSHISSQLPVGLVLYKAGDPARDEFLASVAKADKAGGGGAEGACGTVELELGDALCYHSEVCTVFEVGDGYALVGAARVESWKVSRQTDHGRQDQRREARVRPAGKGGKRSVEGDRPREVRRKHCKTDCRPPVVQCERRRSSSQGKKIRYLAGVLQNRRRVEEPSQQERGDAAVASREKMESQSYLVQA